eukprot:5227653-Amphidinium_carterae.1
MAMRTLPCRRPGGDAVTMGSFGVPESPMPFLPFLYDPWAQVRTTDEPSPKYQNEVFDSLETSFPFAMTGKSKHATKILKVMHTSCKALSFGAGGGMSYGWSEAGLFLSDECHQLASTEALFEVGVVEYPAGTIRTKVPTNPGRQTS